MSLIYWTSTIAGSEFVGCNNLGFGCHLRLMSTGPQPGNSFIINRGNS